MAQIRYVTWIPKQIRESKPEEKPKYKSKGLHPNDTWLFGCSNRLEKDIVELFSKHDTLTISEIRKLTKAKLHNVRNVIVTLSMMNLIEGVTYTTHGVTYRLINRPTVRDMNQWLEEHDYPEWFRL